MQWSSCAVVCGENDIATVGMVAGGKDLYNPFLSEHGSRQGVVRDVMSWRKSREYFYWRTQRRLAEMQLRHTIAHTDTAMSFEEVLSLLPCFSPSLHIFAWLACLVWPLLSPFLSVAT